MFGLIQYRKIETESSIEIDDENMEITLLATKYWLFKNLSAVQIFV